MTIEEKKINNRERYRNFTKKQKEAKRISNENYRKKKLDRK